MSGLLRRLTGRAAPSVPSATRDLGFAELRGGSARVVIVPALGGRIVSLELGGREWLWQDPRQAAAVPTDGASYAEVVGEGGFDECFPTVASCTLPAGGPHAGRVLPDHGELWTQRPEVRVETDATGNAAVCTWHSGRLPYRVERAVRVTPAGVVEMRYRAANEGRERLPYLWAIAPRFPLTPATRIELSGAGAVWVGAEHGIALGGPGAEHQWPHVQLEKSIADLSRPHGVARRYACQLVLAAAAGRVSLVEETGRLDVTFDAERLPMVGLWINKHGWSPARGARPPATIGLGPRSAAPDSLARAVEEKQGARWLEPGETAEWWVRWSSPTTSDA